MEFLKYKKVANPCATMSGQGGLRGHVDMHSPVFQLRPLFPSSLSMVLHSPCLPKAEECLPSKGKIDFISVLPSTYSSGL